MLPASKTPVNQNNLSSQHPAPLPSENEQRLENEQRKSYRFLISSCWTIDIRLFDFYRKRGLGPDQSHYNQSRRWSWLQTALAQITRIVPKWIYTVLKIFSQFTIFEQLALALKNRGCPEFTVLNIYFLLFRIFEQLALALKNRVALAIFHCIGIFFIIQDFWATSACPEQNRVALEIFTVMNIFLHSGFLTACTCPEKQSFPWNFSLYSIYFLHSGVLNN